MPIHDFVLANQTGADFRADTNNALEALATLSSNSTAPTTPYPYMLWEDTSTTPPTLRQRNGANNAWVALWQVGTAAQLILPIAPWVSNSAPGYVLNETDASTDNKKTSLYGSSSRFRLYFETDAGVGGTPAIEITRSGNAPASHTYTGTGFTFTGGDLALSSGNLTVGGNIVSDSTLPRIVLYESDAATDEKGWLILATAGDLWIGATRTDASMSGVEVPLTIKRTGTNVDSIEFNTSSGGYIKCDDSRVLLGGVAAPYGSDAYLHIPVGGATIGALTTEAGSSSARKHIYFRNINGEVGSISTSASATSFTTSSDYRLKENFKRIDRALDKLNSIPVYEFNFKTSPEDNVMGVKAHELQEILPFAVMGEKDEICEETGEALYQGVDYSKIVPLLVAAVQELARR